GLAEQQIGAVLLSDEIEYYANLANLPLIAPFDRDNLQPASYKLTLGSRARVGGEDFVVNEENPLRLPPHDVAVVTTFETLRIPRFLIARWNLRVRMVYEGLLWTGALASGPRLGGPVNSTHL